MLVDRSLSLAELRNRVQIYDFAQALRDSLGWTVLVVVPSSQKSWIGKAYCEL